MDPDRSVPAPAGSCTAEIVAAAAPVVLLVMTMRLRASISQVAVARPVIFGTAIACSAVSMTWAISAALVAEEKSNPVRSSLLVPSVIRRSPSVTPVQSATVVLKSVMIKCGLDAVETQRPMYADAGFRFCPHRTAAHAAAVVVVSKTVA